MKKYIKCYYDYKRDIPFNLESDVAEINNLITSGALKYYDAHPYVDVVTRASLGDSGEICIYGMYNNTETVIESFSSVWDFYDYYDEKYHVLDLVD